METTLFFGFAEEVEVLDMSNDAWVQRVLSRAEMVLPTDGHWLRYAVHAPRNKEGDDNAIEVFMYGRVLGVAVERGDRSEQIWNCGGGRCGRAESNDNVEGAQH